jgi:hypothetical protein
MILLALLLMTQAETLQPLAREDAEPGDWILVEYLAAPGVSAYVHVERWTETPGHTWIAGLTDPNMKPPKTVDFKPDKMPLYVGKVEARRFELNLSYVDAAGNVLAVYERQRWPAGDGDLKILYASVSQALVAGTLPNQSGLALDGVFTIVLDVKGRELGRKLVRR